MKFTKICIVLLLMVPLKILSQKTEVIELDKLTNLPSGKLPFDKEFVIKKYYTEVPGVKYVDIAEINSDNLKESDKIQIDRSSLLFKIHEIKGDKKSTYELHISAPQLEPNRAYDLIITRSLKEIEGRVFYKLYSLLNSGKHEKAELLLDSINNSRRERGNRITFFQSDGTRNTDLFINQLDKKVGNYTVKKIIDSITIYKKRDSVLLKQIDKLITEKFCVKLFKDNSGWKKILDSLDNLYSDPVKFIKHKDLLCCLEECKLTTLKSKAKDSLCGLNICEIFKIYMTSFNGLYNEKNLVNKRLAKNEKLLLTDIQNDLSFMEAEWLTFNTNTISVKTRREYTVTPDFGYVYYGMKPNFYGAVPYLGIQFEFRSMDKDIPFWTIKSKNPLKFLSFSVGVTLASVAREGKSADLFAKTSFLTGFGVRLSNTIRLTGGAIWFNKKDTNPLLDSNKLTATPFIGISLDISLKALLTDLSSLAPINKK